MYKFISATLLVLNCIMCQAQILFKTNDFNVTRNELKLLGDAKIVSERLRLTPAKGNQHGACWYQTKLPLKDGFETEFTFQLSGNDAAQGGGDGFAFVIQGQSDNGLGATGDDLGYKNIQNAVVLEFDTHKDTDDRTRNQVALMRYDPISKTYSRFATVHEVNELNDGKEHFARIEYKAGRLIFYLDSYLFPVLSSKVDIAKETGASSVWLGFTAATGAAFSNHDILAWSILETLPAPIAVDTAKVAVIQKNVIKVKSRKLKIGVFDHNKIDGDVVSLKLNDQWFLTNYSLQSYPKTMDLTLTGFKANLVLYANNLGTTPPNTATITIDDGVTKQSIKLEADMAKSEAITIQFVE